MSKERELLERSIELIDQYWDDSKVGYPRDADNRKLFYEIEELLAQPDINTQYLLDQVARLTAENAMLKEKWSEARPEQEQEPVAWKVIDGTHGGYMFSRIKPTEHTYKYNVVIPLYTGGGE
jgi:hypothetical protein